MCEKKVLIQSNEYDEMQTYRKAQEYYENRHGDCCGEFEFEGLYKGHLVRIFLVKNNSIIGEINNHGVVYKNCFKVCLNVGEFAKCQEAIRLYDAHVCEFRNKPLEAIQHIYLGMVSGTFYLPNHPYNTATKMDNADDMVNFMIRATELEFYF